MKATKTIRVKDKAMGQEVVINEKDYDKSRHTLVRAKPADEDKKEAPQKEAAKE